MLDFVINQNPDHIIVHIGGNDLDHKGIGIDDLEVLVRKLVLFSNLCISKFSHKTVTCSILQLLPRLKVRAEISHEIYNANVIIANQLLKNELKKYSNIRYWNISGVKNPEENIFVDGVHLNKTAGLPKYYRNVRGAMIQALTRS